MVVSGTAINNTLEFTEVWNYSEASEIKAEWLNDYSSFSNMTFGKGKLYVVNNSNEILILNAQTGEKIDQLDMTGVEGGALNITDVKYVDGKVVACNCATTSEGENELKVYVWDKGDMTPQVLLNTTDMGGAKRLGDTFSVEGDLSNGILYFVEGVEDADTKVVTYTITDGIADATPKVLSVTEDGSVSIKFGLSTRVLPEPDGKFWVVGQNYYPTLFDPEGLIMASVNAVALKEDCAGNAFKEFTFKGTTYGLATTYEQNSGRVVLLDGTAGWAEASNIGEYPSNGLGSTRNTSYSTGVEVAVNGDEGVEMWVLVRNQGIAHYKYGTVPTYTDEDDETITGVENVTEAGRPQMTVACDGSIMKVRGVDAVNVTVHSVSGALVAKSNSKEVGVGNLKGVYVVTAVDKAGVAHVSKVVIR